MDYITDKRIIKLLYPYFSLILQTMKIWQSDVLLPLTDFIKEMHKAGGAALGLSCGACFELPNAVYFGSGAVHNTRLNQLINNQHIKIFRVAKSDT